MDKTEVIDKFVLEDKESAKKLKDATAEFCVSEPAEFEDDE